MTFIDTVLRILIGLAGWGFAYFAGTVDGVLRMDECARRDSGLSVWLWILRACSAAQAVIMAVVK